MAEVRAVLKADTEAEDGLSAARCVEDLRERSQTSQTDARIRARRGEGTCREAVRRCDLSPFGRCLAELAKGRSERLRKALQLIVRLLSVALAAVLLVEGSSHDLESLVLLRTHLGDALLGLEWQASER